LPIIKQARSSGLQCLADTVNFVKLHVKLLVDDFIQNVINIEPSRKQWFAGIPDLNKPVILEPKVFELLNKVTCYP
jgi:hypothetical protein